MAKKIFIAADGSTQSLNQPILSSVGQIFLSLYSSSSQIKIYHQGISQTKHNLFLGRNFGRGTQRLASQIAHDIKSNYQTGDNIYLLGYSRGAEAICRALDEISNTGIEIDYLHLLDRIDATPPDMIRHFLKLPIPVRKLKYPKIKTSIHQVSICEGRMPYRNLHLKYPEDTQHIFRYGSHENIGGGNFPNLNFDLSNIILQDLVEHIKRAGFNFQIEPRPLHSKENKLQKIYAQKGIKHQIPSHALVDISVGKICQDEKNLFGRIPLEIYSSFNYVKLDGLKYIKLIPFPFS